MTVHYGDFKARGTGAAAAYPTSTSAAGIFDLSPLAEEMLELLPSYYCLGDNVRRIMELIAVVLQRYSDNVEDLRDQLFVGTATWGLVFWEQMVGIPPNPNNFDYDARRAAIIAKLNECSSEKCFKEGLESITGGPVILIDLNPATNPYQMDIELTTTGVVFPGPISAPTAATSGVGNLTGDYTYKVTYGFTPINLPNHISVSPAALGETSSGVSPDRVNEIQTISGSATDGTFKLTYDSAYDTSFPSSGFTTDPIPWDATNTQVRDALGALPNLVGSSLRVSGGPLPLNPVIVEFQGALSGFPQVILGLDDTGLVGGSYSVTRTQTGTTTYSGSESNTITASGNQVVLTGVPISPDGATSRNIYRKKNSAPYNEYRLVGTIGDNITTVFTDNIPDEDLSETQVVQVSGSGTFKLRFDSSDTTVLAHTSTALDVETALEALSTVAYPTMDVTVTGSSFSSGFTIKFDGGSTLGLDVPLMEVVDPSAGITGSSVETTGPDILTEKNSAFTPAFQEALSYIYRTKPAHLRIREVRSSAFRASINRAGDPV